MIALYLYLAYILYIFIEVLIEQNSKFKKIKEK